jgi:hypothetical protein
MTLAAAQVIDAIAARLVPMAATGGRVATSRAHPWGEAELPAWRVTAEDERVELAMMEPVNQHDLSILARASTRAVADLDDALHALAAAGLALLFALPVPHALQLEGIQRGMASEGEAAVGVITLRLRATFFVDPAAPETLVSFS